MASWILVSLGLVPALLAALELGRRLGRRAVLADPEHALEGTAPLEGAIFGLLGLLFAFAFSGAAGRFDERRELIVREANAIGTAWLRVDLLPDQAQPALREAFRAYLDARLDAHRNGPDAPETLAALARAAELQRALWGYGVTAAKDPALPHGASSLVLGSLNDMFDMGTTRVAATQHHPPTIIYVMLIALALLGAVLAGFGLSSGTARRRFHPVVFAVTVPIVLYVIFDIEHPRRGLVRVDTYDQVLVEVRQSMEAGSKR